MDLLVNQAEVGPESLAVVEVAKRVSREIATSQNQRALRKWHHNLTSKPVHDVITALITLSVHTHIHKYRKKHFENTKYKM